jgi:hypothetical membrane protein
MVSFLSNEKRIFPNNDYLIMLISVLMTLKYIEANSSLDEKKKSPKTEKNKSTMKIIGGICGVMAPLVGITSAYFAARRTENFNWKNKKLSNALDGKGKNIFSIGMVNSGAMEVGFAEGLQNTLQKSIYRDIGTNLMKIGGISLAVLGVTERKSKAHRIAANIYFASTPVALGFIGKSMLDEDKKFEAVGTFFTGISTGIAITAHEKTKLNSLNEIVQAGILAVWTPIIGVQMLASTLKKAKR